MSQHLTCPVCEYPWTRRRYEVKDRFFGAAEGTFVLYHCRSCGLLFQNEGEILERLPSFYPDGYWWEPSGAASRWERLYREWVIRHDQLALLLEICPPAEGLRLLDIGCGSGALVKGACRQGFDAYGLESSPRAVRVAEKEAPGRIFQGTERDMVEAGEKFDVLTLFHSLEHIPGPFAYLKELRKLLNEPGRIVVQVPNSASYQARLLGRRWYGLDCPRHLYNYSSYALLHLLSRAGYRVKRVRHFSLRDNATALVSSLFPGLDPMSQKVRRLRETGRPDSSLVVLKETLYLSLVFLSQPLAWLEAALGRGGTVTVYAVLD